MFNDKIVMVIFVRKLSFLFLLLIITFCSSCGIVVGKKTENKVPADEPTKIPTIIEPTLEVPTEPAPVVTEEVVYDEPADSLEGVDASDLSGLKGAFDSVGNVYSSKTLVYFNELAVGQVNDIYDTNFYCSLNSIYTNNYIYRYSNDFVINLGYVNYNNNVYTVSLDGSTIDEKYNSTVNVDNLVLALENGNVYDAFFSLKDLNSAYVDTYGPTTVEYSKDYIVDYAGWTRVSANKYKCDRKEVCKDFLAIVAPGFSNSGTYMTFKYVTVEVNPTNDAYLRIRLYASPTQSGKLIDSHLDESKPNWYLLFAEAYISNVNEVSIKAFDDIK
jgi:hypothetical protein